MGTTLQAAQAPTESIGSGLRVRVSGGRLLGSDEAIRWLDARGLRLGRRTLLEWAAAGAIGSLRLGHRVRFRESDLAAILEHGVRLDATRRRA